MRRRSVQTTLSVALGGYLRRVDKGGGLTQARVMDAWPEAVGREIAQHTAGLFIREDTLIVRVDSPVWATELTAMSAGLLRRLNECLGQETVRSIRFTVSREVGEQRAREEREQEDDLFYLEDKVDSQPLDPTEIEQIRQSTSAIRNPDLREAVIRATVKDLEWKRGVEKRNAEQGV